MSLVKVSVIVPIYNIEESLLRKCIESIINQTEKNIEIILIDDGSINNALEVCYSYKFLTNVKIIHQENGGVSVARNTGLENASGEWIMFVDPDDYLIDNCIEVLLKNINEKDDVVQACAFYNYDGKKYIKNFFDDNKIFSTLDEKNSLFYRLLSYCDPKKQKNCNTTCPIGAPWGKLYRHSLLKGNSIRFDPYLRRVQDVIFNLYVIMEANTIHYINQPLYVYNYDHLAEMNYNYKPNTFDYYNRFAKARYDWFIKNESKLTPYLHDIFYLGTINTIIFVLKNGPLHPFNKIPLNLVNEECNKLMNNIQFAWIKNYNIKTDVFVSRKSKFLQYIIKNKMWFCLRLGILIKKHFTNLKNKLRKLNG